MTTCNDCKKEMKKSTEKGEWVCDGCGNPGTDRFNCGGSKCDFDLCGKCYIAPAAPVVAAVCAPIECSPGPHYMSHHRHPLQKVAASWRFNPLASVYLCDLCGESVPVSFRCTQGCDDDVCETCWAKEIGKDGPYNEHFSLSAKHEADAKDEAETATAAAAAAEAEAIKASAAAARKTTPVPTPTAVAPATPVDTATATMAGKNVWSITFQKKTLNLKKFGGQTKEDLVSAIKLFHGVGPSHDCLLTDQDGCQVLIHPYMPPGQFTLQVIKIVFK